MLYVNKCRNNLISVDTPHECLYDTNFFSRVQK